MITIVVITISVITFTVITITVITITVITITTLMLQPSIAMLQLIRIIIIKNNAHKHSLFALHIGTIHA
jgi:uncharacterized membrane protein